MSFNHRSVRDMHKSVLMSSCSEDIHEVPIPEGFGVAGKIFFRYLEDCIVDILLDPTFKDSIDYTAKPLYRDGERVFGPLRSGTRWEELESKYPDRTIVPVGVYSDGTEFFKGSGAHPIFGKACPRMVWCTLQRQVLTDARLAVCVGSIRETKRFTDLAWRLACLLPTVDAPLPTKTREELWQYGAGLPFTHYNRLLDQDCHVQCSDGKLRNIAMVFFNWMGDHEEVNTACSQVKVRLSDANVYVYCTHTA
jgi:hypothetical protein